MAADKQSTSQDLLTNLEKALRQGQKLDRGNVKIVAQSEPGSDVEGVLKPVQQGSKTLKKAAKRAQRSPISA